MKKHNVLELPVPEVVAGTAKARSVLEEMVRQGAIQLLQQAIENEVAEYLERHGQERDEDGRQQVVRNGHLPQRELLSGLGPLPVHQPRVRHRDGNTKFSSAILPPYLRRLPSVEALIPALYLKGISSGEMQAALEAILGPQAKGLSATNVVRLKATWEQEYESWRKRDLSRKRYAYWWADGIHFNVRLEDERTCILVLMGALEDGRKELIAITDGYRESKLSWQELLQECKKHGLQRAPQLAVGDGGLGFWAALAEEYGSVRAQRCWVHKTANVLDKLPKGVQAHAKSRLHEIYLAPTNWPPPKLLPWLPTRSFCGCMRRSMLRRASACAKTRRCCLPSTTFPPSTGFISARPIRLNRPLPPCGIGRAKPKAVAVEQRRWRWCSNWLWQLRRSGGASMHQPSWARWSVA
jgi:transposase-like protein